MIRLAGAALVALHGAIHLIGFVVAGVGIAQRAPWALPLTAVLAAVSIAVCVLGLPDTAAGIAVNVALLSAVAWAKRAGTRSLAVTS